MTYQEKLQTPEWRDFKFRIVEKRGCSCQECGGSVEAKGPLELHHITYLRGREPWEYPDSLLLLLCQECHYERQIHDEEARVEFSRLCQQMSSWHVYELAKKMRQTLDQGGELKCYDAHQAIKFMEISGLRIGARKGSHV
jgi:hypothetical protein